MKTFKLWWMVLMMGSVGAANKVGSRDMGERARDVGRREEKTLLRSSANSKLALGAISVKGKAKSPGAAMEELKDRLGALSLRASSVLAGDETPEEMAVGELMQEFHEVQAALRIDPLVIAQATFEEQILMVKEMANSFVVFGQLMPVLEELSWNNGTGSISPFVGQMKEQLQTAESFSGEFVAFLAGLAGATNEEKDHQDFEEDLVGDETIENDTPPVDIELTDRRLAKKATSSSSSTTKTKRNRRITDNESFDFDHQKSDSNEKQHWHGFKDGREYREWKNKHTQIHPNVNHLFQAMEHLYTGNHEALREKMLDMSDRHVRQEHRHDRRLQSSATKLEQCDLLTQCAKGMSLYDLVFYHFSDYIDTNTGIFTDNFRLPPGFKLVEMEASIKAAIAAVEGATGEEAKLGQCDALLDYFHQEEPTKDSAFWAWKAGVVSEVCFSSGTTKKIDLYLIKKHIGMKTASQIMKETLHSAQTLHAIRDKAKYPDEPQIFKGAQGFRYPEGIAGYKTDPNTGRPILPVKIEDFYVMRYDERIDANLSTQQSQECPSFYVHELIDSNHHLRCTSNLDVVVARSTCASAGGTFSTPYEEPTPPPETEAPQWPFLPSYGYIPPLPSQLPGYFGPHTCSFPPSANIVLEDALFNSTRRIFGDSSLGQIAGLAETHAEILSISKDKSCPKNFEYSGTVDDGVLCGRVETTKCGNPCVKAKCSEHGGTWTKGPRSRLIAEVQNGTVTADPHMIAGQQQLPENGFQNYWNDWDDIKRMIDVAKAMAPNSSAANESQTLYGPDTTENVNTYSKAMDLCRSKGQTLASFDDVCKNGVPTFGQQEGDQWMPVSDMENNWIQVGTASHKVCVSHRDAGHGAPAWGNDPTNKIISAANYVLCTGVPSTFVVVVGNIATGTYTDLETAKADLAKPHESCKFSGASGTYSITHLPKLPGYCCLDAADVSGTWGEPYHCDQECVNFAPSFAGISQSTCNIWGGKFCLEEQDCSPLKRCVGRYLEDAQAIGTSTFNPTFASYVGDSPNITNPNNAEQCGKARAYFGFEKTFPVDMKICKEIGEYKNSGDMTFLNDVVKDMAPLPEPAPDAAPAAEPLQTSAPAEGPGALPAPAPIEQQEMTQGKINIKLQELIYGKVDLTEIKIQNHQIETHKKQPLVAGKPAGSVCNDVRDTAFLKLTFMMDLTMTTVDGLYSLTTNFQCPDDGWGVTWTSCALPLNIINAIGLAVLIVFQTVEKVLEFKKNELCGGLDPYTEEGALRQVDAVHKNLLSMYDTLALRQTQSHVSLNSISQQLPLIGDSLNAIHKQHGNIMNSINGQHGTVVENLKSQYQSTITAINEQHGTIADNMRTQFEGITEASNRQYTTISENMETQHGTTMQAIDDQHQAIDAKLNDILNIRGATTEATLSGILLAIESSKKVILADVGLSKEKILEDVKAQCTAGTGSGTRMLASLSSKDTIPRDDMDRGEKDKARIIVNDALEQMKIDMVKIIDEKMEEQEKRIEIMLQKLLSPPKQE